MPSVSADDELVIELSRSKAIFIIVGSFAFVAAGYWMFSMDTAEMKQLPIDDPLFIHGVGIASMVFFGLTGIFGVRKLFDKRPAWCSTAPASLIIPVDWLLALFPGVRLPALKFMRYTGKRC